MKSPKEWVEEARTKRGVRDFVGFELQRRGEKEKEGRWKRVGEGREEEEEKERMEERVAIWVREQPSNHASFFFFFPSLSVAVACSHNNKQREKGRKSNCVWVILNRNKRSKLTLNKPSSIHVVEERDSSNAPRSSALYILRILFSEYLLLRNPFWVIYY